MDTKTAVILGGGASTRFYPFNFQNKSLVKIAGRTLFERTIEVLKKSGIEKIIVIDDSNSSLLDSISDHHGITCIQQSDPKGMGEALILASEEIKDENFFVLSPYHFEFDSFVNDMRASQKNPQDLVIVTKKDKDYSQFGGISLENGKVSIHEKETETFSSRIVSMYLLHIAFINSLKLEKKHHYSFEDAITNYKEGEIVLLETSLPTISLKFPWDILSVKDYLLEKMKKYISPTAEVSSNAKITGNVHISEGVKIMDGAVISGPVYIGENAYIGTNAILRNGVIIEEGAVVGAGMEIKNSVLLKNSTTHSGFIGDSVVGEDVKIAAGFITGNVRLDRREIFSTVKGEKINTHKKNLGCFIGNNSSIGIHVGSMPGVIIGRNVKIGPGTTIMKNIEDSVTYYTEFKEIIKR